MNRSPSIAIALALVLLGPARGQATIDDVLARHAAGATGDELVAGLVRAGGVAGVDRAALQRLRAAGLDEAVVRFVDEWRTLDDWATYVCPDDDYELRYPSAWHAYVDSIGTLTVSRTEMLEDTTEVNFGISFVLVGNPDPERFHAGRLDAAGAELHEAVVALAGRRGDEIWDIRPGRAEIDGLPCARFDALMNTHRDDRLEIWTHYAFPDDPLGRMLILMASRNREEAGSVAILDRVLASFRFRKEPWPRWSAGPDGPSIGHPPRWVVRTDDEGFVRLRPTALPRPRSDAELVYRARPAGDGPPDETHRSICFEVGERLGGGDLVPGPTAEVVVAGRPARATWLTSSRRPLRVRVVTIDPTGGADRIDCFWLVLVGHPEDNQVEAHARTLDRILGGFEP